MAEICPHMLALLSQHTPTVMAADAKTMLKEPKTKLQAQQSTQAGPSSSLEDMLPGALLTQPSPPQPQLMTKQTLLARHWVELAAEQKKMHSGRLRQRPTRLVRALDMQQTGLLMALSGLVTRPKMQASMPAEQQPRLRTT